MTVIKKYSNRRLYHTGESRYITLEELAQLIRDGTDVKVVDAKTGEDLTGPTLTQIVIDSRGAAHLLPASLLTQLIRLRDDALAEFLGSYMAPALELYLEAQRGAMSMSPFFPMSSMPFGANNPFVRMMMGQPAWGPSRPAPSAPAPPPPSEPGGANRDELAELRRELEELKKAVRKSEE